MSTPALSRTSAVVASFLFLCFASLSAFAECPDSKVRQLAAQGKTVAAIARTCQMDKEDVRSILEEDADEDGGDTTGGSSSGGRLPSGAPVGQCGCWGFVSPSLRQPHPACRSGVAKPAMCNAMCPAGGYQWRGVCA